MLCSTTCMLYHRRRRLAIIWIVVRQASSRQGVLEAAHLKIPGIRLQSILRAETKMRWTFTLHIHLGLLSTILHATVQLYMRGHRVVRYKLAISYQELHGVSLFSHLMDHLRPLPQVRPSTEGPMVQTMSRLVQERGSLLLIRGTRGPAIVNLPLRPIRHRRLVSSTPDRTRHCPGMPLGHFLMSLRKRGRVGRNMINTKRSIRRVVNSLITAFVWLIKFPGCPSPSSSTS